MIRLSRIIHSASRQLAQITESTTHLEKQGKVLYSPFQVHSSGFKSHLSLEKIYPNSDSDFLRTREKVMIKFICDL